MITKLRKRLTLITLSSANNLVVPVVNVLLSLFIVKFCGAQLWGTIVQLLLWTGIATNVMAWGNKDFLLKRYSLSPASVSSEWQISFGSRSILFLVAIAGVIIFPIELRLKTWIAIFLFARFIYLSYDSLIIYKRKFAVTIVLETVGFLIIISVIYLAGVTDFIEVFCLFSVAELIKTLAIVIYFRKTVRPAFLKDLDWNYFGVAFSFFVLYFSGMLASKVDLLCGIYYLSKSDLAHYQVLMNFFQLAQIAALFILSPYVKNIYRLNDKTAKKISTRFFLWGIPLSLLIVIAVKLIIEYVYGFSFTNFAYLLGVLFIIPSYYTTFTFYRIVKQGGQNQIVYLSFLYSACGAVLIISFLKMFQVSIYFILAAMTVAEWIQLAGYFILFNKKTPLTNASIS